jgi:hypothetical protein
MTANIPDSAVEAAADAWKSALRIVRGDSDA